MGYREHHHHPVVVERRVFSSFQQLSCGKSPAYAHSFHSQFVSYDSCAYAHSGEGVKYRSRTVTFLVLKPLDACYGAFAGAERR